MRLVLPTERWRCRWCGTKPERAPIGPYVWKGAGVVAFVSLAIGAWLAKNDTPSPSKPATRTFVADTLPTNQPQAESFGRKIVVVQRDSTGAAPTDSTASLTVADSIGETTVAVATTDTTQTTPTSVVPAEPVSMQSAGTVAATDSVPVDDPPADPAPAPIRATRVVTPPRATPRPLDRTPARVAEKAPSRVLARAPDRSTRSDRRTPASAIDGDRAGSRDREGTGPRRSGSEIGRPIEVQWSLGDLRRSELGGRAIGSDPSVAHRRGDRTEHSRSARRDPRCLASHQGERTRRLG